jgi:hypothetical protein
MKKKHKRSYEIIDNLLTMVVMRQMAIDSLVDRSRNINDIQDDLLKQFPTWVEPALEYLIKEIGSGREVTLCMATDDWVDRFRYERKTKKIY